MTKIIRGSGGGCFAKGTLISTPTGAVNIEDLKAGDEVIAFNDKGELSVQNVELCHYHKEEPIWLYKFWNHLEVKATPNHWVLNQFGNFAEIGTLTEQDAIIDGDGHIRPLISSEFVEYGEVYNLTISNTHTYIADHIRVHNTGKGAGKLAETIRGSGGGGGKGGGGGGGRVPQESPDSLRSIAYANVLDLLCEGEIGGLVNGHKSIYLNETPLQNADNSYNFSGVTIETRNGTQGQSYIAGFPSVESETDVSVKVETAVPVVRQITNSEVDAVRVRISLPQLTDQDVSTGDLNGTSVTYAIDVQSNGGGYVEQLQSTISGKTTSIYERSHRVELTGSSPWDIRVRRITYDSTRATLQNDIYFEAYTEIIDGKFRYPNTALVGMRIDSSQFNSVPRRAYEIKLLKVKIPSNYNPTTRVYTGVWDGTFTVDWTDNPAWCFYDLVTNTRYGLGDYVDESQVDKWTLYAIAQYCDELVDNGFGGEEPRYTCNIYFQTREEAYNIINNMATIFRGMPYWSSGAITLGYDAPSDPVYQYTNANVIDGEFTYSGSASKARHTVALVTWNDPDDFYRQKVEYVEDIEGIAKYGIVQTEVVAIGCTSRGQANRVGRWLLYTEQLETETVSFKTGLEGFIARPSQVIQISDELRAGSRRAGRIRTATTTQITLDQNVSGITGILSGTLSIILPDGSLETKNISSVSTNVVTVASAFSLTPQANGVWMVETTSVEAQLFKIISAVENQDSIDITALAHNPNKYAYVEEGLVLNTRDISDLSLNPEPPTALNVTESLYQDGADIKVLVTLSWTSSPSAIGYIVSYKVDDGNFINLPQTSANSIDIRNAAEGVYTFKVFAINTLAKRSIPAETTITILGKTAPPADIEEFTINIVKDQAHLTWTPVADIDLSHYVIRHCELTTGATYAKAIDLIPKVSRPASFAIAPAMTGTYFIKAVDKSGIESLVAKETVALIENIKDLNFIESLVENPNFDGQKDGLVRTYENLLVLDTTYNFDSIGGLFDDAEGLFDGGNGSVLTNGTYYFNEIVDLGDVYTSRVTAKVKSDRVDYINLPTDSPTPDFDNLGDSNIEFYISTTEDDPNSSPAVWTEWRRFFVGDYKARGLKFKIILSTTTGFSTPSLEELSIDIDMPDRVYSQEDIVSGTNSGGYAVTYTPAFYNNPALGVTAQNLSQGDYYEIITKSNSGFTIRFKNSSGTVVSRQFDFIAKGYGELAN